ncbi:cobalamin-dependent protein [Herbivorax sp. ANBcel31]|uniref:cobalamin B12-binding domain-containing protein n=1 Tax=Herbivorax sp. ANBcel31 TaxID=3069754 RepID=UPI0027B13B7E|nr:cobalamin-dependent protein [Herbivorax sp. ANBcel31]MDQ2087418.1 cobalamin-dependent protein [Herbivorax sp. ANBcel31]
MKNNIEEFNKYLKKEDKEKCVFFALKLLKDKDIDVVGLYTKILEPTLNSIGCEIGEENLCIWKEHVRTSIVRTIIECAFPYVIDERDAKGVLKKNQKVVVVCPDGEYHEVGARIIADFFTLCGYDTVFVGGSTPKTEFLSVVDSINPCLVSISVTNYYNLISAKKTIELLKEKANNKTKIAVGGNAFKNKENIHKEMGADYLMQTFEDIRKVAEGELK